jgi:hypothetical protein
VRTVLSDGVKNRFTFSFTVLFSFFLLYFLCITHYNSLLQARKFEKAALGKPHFGRILAPTYSVKRLSGADGDGLRLTMLANDCFAGMMNRCHQEKQHFRKLGDSVPAAWSYVPVPHIDHPFGLGAYRARRGPIPAITKKSGRQRPASRPARPSPSDIVSRFVRTGCSFESVHLILVCAARRARRGYSYGQVLRMTNDVTERSNTGRGLCQGYS